MCPAAIPAPQALMNASHHPAPVSGHPLRPAASPQRTPAPQANPIRKRPHQSVANQTASEARPTGSAAAFGRNLPTPNAARQEAVIHATFHASRPEAPCLRGRPSMVPKGRASRKAAHPVENFRPPPPGMSRSVARSNLPVLLTGRPLSVASVFRRRPGRPGSLQGPEKSVRKDRMRIPLGL